MDVTKIPHRSPTRDAAVNSQYLNPKKTGVTLYWSRPFTMKYVHLLVILNVFLLYPEGNYDTM